MQCMNLYNAEGIHCLVVYITKPLRYEQVTVPVSNEKVRILQSRCYFYLIVLAPATGM